LDLDLDALMFDAGSRQLSAVSEMTTSSLSKDNEGSVTPGFIPAATPDNVKNEAEAGMKSTVTDSDSEDEDENNAECEVESKSAASTESVEMGTASANSKCHWQLLQNGRTFK
jgi:hypothetical protein